MLVRFLFLAKFQAGGAYSGGAYKKKRVIVMERPEYLGYPGRVYRQGGVDFFSAK